MVENTGYNNSLLSWGGGNFPAINRFIRKNSLEESLVTKLKKMLETIKSEAATCRKNLSSFHLSIKY